VKPWVGAVAAAAAILAAPSVALAGEDDPAQLQFKLPNAAAVHDFEALGLNMDHGMTRNPDGTATISAWATDEQVQLARVHGYEVVGTITSKYQIDTIRAQRNETLEGLKRAKLALKDNAEGRAGKSALPGTVRVQRAEFWENNVERYISIEATTTQVTYNAQGNYNGPNLVADIYDAAGNRIGGGNLQAISDNELDNAYLYHGTRFVLGLKSAGGADPAMVKVASSSNGDVDTLAAKRWMAKDPPKTTAALKGFVTHYNDSQEAYKKMRDLAAEFTTTSEAVKLPEQTRGYQRRAQTMLGYTNATGTGPTATVPYIRFDANNLPVAGASPTTAQQGGTVVLTSKTYGHQGGNSLAAQINAPAAGAANQPLSVALNGNKVNINPATDAAGAITSTAAQVVAALNANTQIANVVTASLWRTNAGAGVVQAGPSSPLNDLLRAPASFPRGPQDQWMLRIGKVRDGSKVGVFLYCQEHGNEIATSGVCLETAERLVRNYGTDAETTALVDGLDIFIVPQINGDGATHSLYDSNRRTNLSNHCEDTVKYTSKETDPASRNGWGVDLNRNFSVGSALDGYFGATATDCTNGNFAGPNEFSEPEARNESWVQKTFRNIKFANNIHSSGGYFMWPPGAYIEENRVPLAYPPYGTLNYFDQTATTVLNAILSHRGTGINPAQTGPVIDVLYSAAGNSADEAYYANGIIGYDFEIGATHYNENYDPADPSKGTRTCGAGQQPTFGVHPTNPCQSHEGFHEAMEFTDGNYGLLRSALDYSNDTTAPAVQAGGREFANVQQNVRFTSSEATSIYYTTDGSTPTTASTEWKPTKARALPEPVEIADDATLKWIAVDFKGNTSGVGSKTFMIETAAPTATLTGFTEGQVFTQGRPVPVSFTCADEAGGSGLESCVGSTSNGMLNTSQPGTFTYTVTATDRAGNQTVVSRSYTVIPATNVNGNVSGNVPATLSLSLGPAAQFGAITPGVNGTYNASTTANVISSAGDALLSVSDPSSTNTGHLVNGAFFLPQPLQARARNATTTSPPYNNVGSSASPLNLLSWSAPISNDALTLEFRQVVNANDALRTGTYSKALTFTLSTTQP
jgi:Zinc carboxypeptidase/Chitobiase/beta-hexosaminidase C-terminal domain